MRAQFYLAPYVVAQHIEFAKQCEAWQEFRRMAGCQGGTGMLDAFQHAHPGQPGKAIDGRGNKLKSKHALHQTVAHGGWCLCVFFQQIVRDVDDHVLVARMGLTQNGEYIPFKKVQLVSFAFLKPLHGGVFWQWRNIVRISLFQ
ncbi:hypothetical protein D3C81_1253970 [compost metagenome]